MELKTPDELFEKYGPCSSKDGDTRLTMGDFAARLRRMDTSGRFHYLHWFLLAFIGPNYAVQQRELFYLVRDLNGLLRAWECSPPNVVAEIRGRGGIRLDLARIQGPLVYGSPAGRPLERVIRDIVKDWAAGPAGGPAGMELEPTRGATNFLLQEYRQKAEPVFDAIEKLAQLVGLHLTYICDEPGSFRLLLSEPDLIGPP